MTIFLRCMFGLVALAASIALLTFYPVLFLMLIWSPMAIAQALSFLVTLGGSYIYSFSGKFIYIPLIAILSLVSLLFLETWVRESGDLKFCEEFARECLRDKKGLYVCPSTSDLDSFERICNEILKDS